MRTTYHEIQNWQRCRLRWQLAREYESLVVKPQLTLGKAIHDALAAFYWLPPWQRNPITLSTRFQASLPEQLGQVADSKTKASLEEISTKGEAMLLAYWNTYGQDKTWDVVNVESEIPLQLGPVQLLAHPDIYIASDPIILVEHKTGVAPDLEHLLMFDGQKAVYSLALAKHFHRDVTMVYNIISTPEGKKPPKCERHSFPMPEFHDTLDTLLAVTSEIGLLPVYPTLAFTCSYDCQFYPVCLARESGADADYILETQFKRREKA